MRLDIYDIGIYLRLSREDEDKEAESQSITNQRDFLINFVHENGWNIKETYIDDGFSGLNFDRPDFLRMTRDIECGKINMVITKDLSRLGRDYIMTGHYIERYFPEKNVRYIAVNDGVDTSSDSSCNDMTPFKSVMNDMYAKDISKKVRTALMTKKRKGDFIGSTPPFGYNKDSNNKNKLIINPETAPYISEIFHLYLSGSTLSGIAGELTKQGIPTPSQFKKLTHTQQRFKGVWNEAIIKRILTSETYIGNLTQNRSKSINYKLDKKINLPKKDWVIVEGTHEAIISKEDFEAVALKLSKRSYQAKKRRTPVTHLLTGLIFCADCGSPMSFVRESEQRTYLTCSTWRQHSKLHLCTSHCIREDYVEAQIKLLLKDLAQTYFDAGKFVSEFENDPKQQDSILKQKKQIDIRISRIKETLMHLYTDRVNGIVCERDYIEMSARLNDERDNCLYQLVTFENINRDPMHTKKVKNFVTEYLSFENLERSDLLMLVDRVMIHKYKKITIEFAFSEPEHVQDNL
jgi:site-specific DNA recombinase